MAEDIAMISSGSVIDGTGARAGFVGVVELFEKRLKRLGFAVGEVGKENADDTHADSCPHLSFRQCWVGRVDVEFAKQRVESYRPNRGGSSFV